MGAEGHHIAVAMPCGTRGYEFLCLAWFLKGRTSSDLVLFLWYLPQYLVYKESSRVTETVVIWLQILREFYFLLCIVPLCDRVKPSLFFLLWHWSRLEWHLIFSSFLQYLPSHHVDPLHVWFLTALPPSISLMLRKFYHHLGAEAPRPNFWVIIGLHTFPTSSSAFPQVRLDTAAPCPSWDGCDCLQTAGLNLDCIFSVWGCLWNTALIHWSPAKATSNCSIREHSLFLTFLQGVKSTSLSVGSSKTDRNCLHVHKKLIVFFLLCLWEWMFAFEISIFLLFWYLVLVQMCKTLIKIRFLFKVYIQEMKIICMHR